MTTRWDDLKHKASPEAREAARAEARAEKPLHLRVAEALGDDTSRAHEIDEGPGCMQCTHCGQTASWAEGRIAGACVRRYDTDWSMTGPKIKELGIWLTRFGDTHWEACRGHDGQGFHDEPDPEYGEAPDPLEAVCMLILQLGAKGKLPPQ